MMELLCSTHKQKITILQKECTVHTAEQKTEHTYIHIHTQLLTTTKQAEILQ